MQSALQKNEASLNVRDANRRFIQPYIYKHPLGGGLATSSNDGIRFNLGHPLAGFPPDSGLLKYAIETGWIGLILVVIFYFIMIAQGINYYFMAADAKSKVFILAITVTLFSIIITEYSQVTLGKIPGAIFFYSCLSIMKRLVEFESAKPTMT